MGSAYSSAACAIWTAAGNPSWSVTARAAYPNSAARATSSAGALTPSSQLDHVWQWSSAYTRSILPRARLRQHRRRAGMAAPVELGIVGYTDAVEIGRGGFAVVYRARQPAFN